MRKITRNIVAAFKSGMPARDGNTHTDGKTLFLHGNAVARRDRGQLEICWSNWVTSTTRERINGVLAAYESAWRVGINKGAAECRNWQNGWSAPMDCNTWTVVPSVKL